MDELTQCLAAQDVTPAWLSNAVSLLDSAPLVVSFDCDTLRCHQWLLGHHATDQQLCRVAKILNESFPGLQICRINGDEFVLVANRALATFEHLKNTTSMLTDPDAFKQCNYERHHSWLEQLLVLVGLRKPTAETNAPPFTVSICATKFDEPRTVRQFLDLHSKNVARIAEIRYSEIEFVDPESKYPLGRTAIVEIA